jgi:hypothetical protein
LKPINHTYGLEFVAGESRQRRGIAFLVSRDRKVTAKTAFGSLGGNAEKTFRTRFDAWVDGKINKKWYHGWDHSELQGKYTRCFVFKYKKNRFYGFLCNPKSSDRSYQVCILVSHALKKEWETDEADLRDVYDIRKTPAVQKTIIDYFRETL